MTTGRGAEATDAFLQAIDLEIEAILMGSATDVIPLRQGTRTGKDGDDFEYVFQARSKPDVARRSLIHIVHHTGPMGAGDGCGPAGRQGSRHDPG